MKNQKNKPWWKFRAHHWKTETICDKILEDVFIARMLLKGYTIALTSTKDGITLQVLDLGKCIPRATMTKAGTLEQDGRCHIRYTSIYRLYHPKFRLYKHHFEDSEQNGFGLAREFQHAIEEDRKAAIRVYETLRYIKKSKANAKRYKASTS